MSGRNNGDIRGKIIVRQAGLEMLGGRHIAKVLDLFAGAGVMWNYCYRECAAYCGVDRKDGGQPGLIVGDNRRLLPRLMLSRDWNVFDCDAYANPWIIVHDVCRLRRPGQFVTVTTCGLSRGLKGGRSNPFVRGITGTEGLSDIRLLYRWYDDVIRWIVQKCAENQCNVLTCRRMRSRMNGDVWYYVVLWEKCGARDRLRHQRMG